MPSQTQQALLALLQTAPGQYFSGQQLAQQLGLSRAAIHKAAAALQKQGWQITAVPRRGYCLLGVADVLAPEAMGDYSAPVYFFESLPSTNTTAKQLALQGAPHGTLVVAGQQTAGRGRLGRSFASPPGGLYCSVILRPGIAAPQSIAVTGAAAVAVARALEQLCGIRLGIKWVNDLYLGGKKVCGILTEAAADLETGLVDYLVVGIGLNLTTPPEAFPPEVRPIAASLWPGGKSPLPRAMLAAAIARQLLALCPSFDYLEEYRARCFVPGHWVTVRQTDGSVFSAQALAVDDAGCLVVQTAEGRRLALRHGEVSVKPTILSSKGTNP